MVLNYFRFTIQGEVMDIMVGEASLYVWDIQLEESVQRKGLGKHLLVLLELIARSAHTLLPPPSPLPLNQSPPGSRR